MFKRIIPYLITVIVAITVFVGGFYSGIHFFGLMKTSTMLESAFFETTQSMYILNYIDKGENIKAREALQLHINAGILQINGLAKYADSESVETACNILNSISKHRAEHPELYLKQYDEISVEIPKVLKKWESCK